ncbi:hypothetical protein AAY473_018609 [Plecturocebus cupreus]
MAVDLRRMSEDSDTSFPSRFLIFTTTALVELQLPVSYDGDIQDQLDIHQLLVLMQLPRYVLLSLLQGGLQLGQLGVGILNGQLPVVLSICDGSLQGSPLAFKAFDLSLKPADAPVHLGDLNDLSLCVPKVIPVLPSQCLQLLILIWYMFYASAQLRLVISYCALTSAMMLSMFRE